MLLCLGELFGEQYTCGFRRIKMEQEKKDKTLYYILETLNLLVENEKVLLKRIKKLEGQLDMLAGAVFDRDDDIEEDRTIH